MSEQPFDDLPALPDSGIPGDQGEETAGWLPDAPLNDDAIPAQGSASDEELIDKAPRPGFAAR